MIALYVFRVSGRATGKHICLASIVFCGFTAYAERLCLSEKKSFKGRSPKMPHAKHIR
jgi:hypothetical protein